MEFIKIIDSIVVDVINLKNKNIIILGDNGIGKTTVLNRIYQELKGISIYIKNIKSKLELFDEISSINNNINTIIIDNIEVNLEYKDRLNILEELKEKFKNFRFIISTNFPNILINSVDFVHFTIFESNYILADSNDIKDVNDIDRIKNFIKKDKEEVSETKLLFCKHLNKHLLEIITESDIKEIEEFLLKNKNIYPYQKEVFLKIIRGGNYEIRKLD